MPRLMKTGGVVVLRALEGPEGREQDACRAASLRRRNTTPDTTRPARRYRSARWPGPCGPSGMPASAITALTCRQPVLRARGHKRAIGMAFAAPLHLPDAV